MGLIYYYVRDLRILIVNGNFEILVFFIIDMFSDLINFDSVDIIVNRLLWVRLKKYFEEFLILENIREV